MVENQLFDIILKKEGKGWFLEMRTVEILPD
jgi:hypothetical protein